MRRTGAADLPLHSGHVPPWMLRIMERLGRAIVMYMVEERGPGAVLSMLRDPYWFQAFNNVIGMDWDSSGSTTIVLWVLKKASWEEDLGFLVLGGKGRWMREVPREAEEAGERLGIDPDRIAAASRAAARMDSSLLQDGYDLYIHGVAVARGGGLVVVQQGMNPRAGIARRYHLEEPSFERPHSGIAGLPGRIVLDASSPSSRGARRIYVDLLSEGPRRLERLLREANRRLPSPRGLDLYLGEPASQGGPERGRAQRPYYKPVRPSRSLLAAAEAAWRWGVSSEEDLLSAPGIGPALVRALALVADIIYGVPTSSDDPVTHPLDPYLYSYAVGGKDGVPYPFDARTALEAARFLEEALYEAKIGEATRRRALARLRRLVRSWTGGAGDRA